MDSTKESSNHSPNLILYLEQYLEKRQRHPPLLIKKEFRGILQLVQGDFRLV